MSKQNLLINKNFSNYKIVSGFMAREKWKIIRSSWPWAMVYYHLFFFDSERIECRRTDRQLNSTRTWNYVEEWALLFACEN